MSNLKFHHSLLLKKRQCGASIKSPHCIRSRTALSLPTHRVAFFRSPLIFLSSCHAELVSASVRGDVLEMARCEILKQVQDDICVLTAHHSPLISSQKNQCGAPIKSPHCIRSRTALSLPMHRIAFRRYFNSHEGV